MKGPAKADRRGKVRTAASYSRFSDPFIKLRARRYDLALMVRLIIGHAASNMPGVTRDPANRVLSILARRGSSGTSRGTSSPRVRSNEFPERLLLLAGCFMPYHIERGYGGLPPDVFIISIARFLRSLTSRCNYIRGPKQ